MKKYSLALLAALSLAGLNGNAQADGDFYLGAGFGDAQNDGCDNVRGILVDQCSDSKTVWKLVGGYHLNQYVDFELAFNNLGQYSVDFPADEATTTPATSLKSEGESISLSAIGYLPLTDSLAVLGKVGYSQWDVDVEVLESNIITSFKDDGSDLTYGVGFAWNSGTGYALRLEWERYNDTPIGLTSEGEDVDVISLVYTVSF